ncbi:alpha/beta fold hydrolase [Gloeobacter morelensis]|uniref:Alpha/beta fold hydrolase n=1 Tax=Gloeobacter morelensis MG652769 TaxID=2781736 RepID=A0ABY3PSU6_9CYAN|nr:alpha/beta fold hydrolase [Gloeobacter morelensis]UFP96534.1 alpha/beta fold hydrolase [Gloeobacter morelensis MG652769]
MLSERPLLVYLPGLDGTGKLFFQQEFKLAAYCDVTALSIPVDDRGEWPDLIERVDELIAAHPGRRVILCGESFGGCLAMIAAIARPEAFDRLVLVNPATSWRRQTWLNQGARWLALLPAVSLQVAAVVFLPFLSATNRLTPEDRRTLLTTVRLVSRDTILHRLELMQQCDCDGQLHRLSMPTLLLGGRMDRLLPSVQEVRWLAERLPDARVEILPYSGHAALIEAELDLGAYLLKYGFVRKPSERTS